MKLHGKIASWTAGLLLVGCSREPTRPLAPPSATPPVAAVDAGAPPVAEVAEAPPPEAPKAPYRTALGLRGSELYLAPTFTAPNGRYDLIVHFHGEGRFQEANVARAELNVAVVSINLGLGTDPYSNTFKNPQVFERLLADVQSELAKDGRGGATPKLHRLALSAWSAGFSSVARVMTPEMTEKVDAVLLADGFFTNFTNPKKRTVNKQGLERFVRFASLARTNDKLFSITHTTIPTGPYPSVQECVGTLLELQKLSKKQCSIEGPRRLGETMHQFYTVDDGSFHIHGFRGVRASDHVRQLHAMGETTYPYLKSRWAKRDAADGAPSFSDAGALR